MKLKGMFIIAAIVCTLSGILTILEGIGVVPPLSGPVNASGEFVHVLAGASILPFAVIAWLVRNAEASKTRDSVVLGFTLVFALWALVGLFGLFTLPAPYNQSIWMPTVLNGLIAVGFFITGRASMSTSAS